MTNVTYGQLDEVLRSLGFVLRVTPDRARVYKHPTGALVDIPYFPDGDPVLSRYLVAAGMQVDGFNIIGQAAFNELLIDATSRRPA